MPPNIPIAGRRALYAKSPTTGDVYEIAVSSDVEVIDDLLDVDTVTGPPLDGMVLKWSASNGATGATGATGPTGSAAGMWVPGIASTVGSIDDLNDVDTSTTGPTGGSSLVWDDTASQWVPGPGGLTISTDLDNEIMLGTDGGLYSNEVHLGPTGPTLNGPDLWANPDEGLLFAAATGPTGAVEWVPVGGSEVEVDLVEPTGDWELWVDTSALAPPPGTVGLALNDLTDVDTATTAPAVNATLTWDGTNWIPGAATGDYLPLAGGAVTGLTTFADQVDLNGPVNAATPITWPATTADKLILYPTAGSRFGLGVESGTLSLFVDQAANKVSFKIGGTERAFIDQNGLGPRSTINVSYLNGFTGSTSFRVNPAMVTLAMMNVVNANDIWGFNELQVCALPAGVPAPFATVSASGATYIGSSVTLHFRVEVRSTGVYIMTLADNILAGDLTCSVSLTYSR